MEYSKIDTLFERDENFVVNTERLKHPVIATISHWDVTEKIDGMNIRCIWNVAERKVVFGGRTDNAQIHTDLIRWLYENVSVARLQEIFPDTDAVIYGEGYGAGIQKGGCYRKTKAFRVFDVLVGGRWWLDWANTVDVAKKLGIQTAPYLGRFSLAQIISKVKNGFYSDVAIEDCEDHNVMAEGIVARTIEPLFDKKGQRLIIKLKTKDFKLGRR